MSQCALNTRLRITGDPFMENSSQKETYSSASFRYMETILLTSQLTWLDPAAALHLLLYFDKLHQSPSEFLA